MPLFRNRKLDEATGYFKNKLIPKKEDQGEGYEDINLSNQALSTSISSFNLFNERYINKGHDSEIRKISTYREMSQTPEIATVVEDASIESTQENDEGQVIYLNVLDGPTKKNENKLKVLNDEFRELFYNRLKIQDNLFSYMYSYFVDGRIYLERVGKPKIGVTGLKKLPSETMDFKIGPEGKIDYFVQYLTKEMKMPKSFEEGEKDPKVVVFYPSQISYVNSGIFGHTRKDVLGYLEKSKRPYNQLNLLETSVIIYRIIRSPERLVFRIDTGNMPKEKAFKFVEKVQKKFRQTETYDPHTGQMINKAAITSLLENYFLPQSADGRGSQIDTIGGNAAAFAELDDIYYFQRKLYRSLKYPMSRVTKMQERQEGEILYQGGQTGEITRDEIKWAKFLERQQNRLCFDLKEVFLLHLELKGIKAEYELKRSHFNVRLTPPNQYKDQMNQLELETKQNNYQNLANNEEFPKTWLMMKYMKMDEKDFKELKEYQEKDKKYLPQEEEGEF